MPSYKLSYFNGKGRAELSRLVLTAAGEQFQDNRLEGAGWGALKPSTPWGLLPVLEVDGKFLGQSNTIARYLARKHGLAGGDDWEQAHVESALDATDDMIAGKSKIMQAEESRKPVEAKKLKEEILPKYLAAFEKYIAENGKNGHVVGSKLTLADLALFNIIDQMISGEHLAADDLSKYPKSSEVYNGVKNEPKIAEYLKKRPVTPF